MGMDVINVFLRFHKSIFVQFLGYFSELRTQVVYTNIAFIKSMNTLRINKDSLYVGCKSCSLISSIRGHKNKHLFSYTYTNVKY